MKYKASYIEIFFSIIVLITFILCTAWFLTNGFANKNKYTLHVSLNDANGISTATNVAIKGISVGNVSSVRLDSDLSTVHVTLNIDSHLSIPEDSSLIIKSAGIFKGKYLAIIPGTTGVMKHNDRFVVVAYDGDITELIDKFLG